MNTNPVKLTTICLAMSILCGACTPSAPSAGQPQAEKEQIRLFELSRNSRDIYQMFYSPILENGLWIHFQSFRIQLDCDTGEITELFELFGDFSTAEPYFVYPDPVNPGLIWFSHRFEGLMNYNSHTGGKKVFGLSEAFNSLDQVFLFGVRAGKLLVATVQFNGTISDQDRFFAFDPENNAFMPVSRLDYAAKQNVNPLVPLQLLIKKHIIEEGRYKYALANGELQKIDTVNNQVYRSSLKNVSMMWDDPRNKALWLSADQDQLVRIDKHNNQDVFSLIPQEELAVRNGYVTTTEDVMKIQNALEAEDYIEIERMIRAGVDVNVRIMGPYWNWLQETPTPLLLLAIAAEQKDLARLMIETKGCDVNVEYGKGLTPLVLADFMGNQDLVDLLRQKGARDPVKVEVKPITISGVPSLIAGNVLDKSLPGEDFGVFIGSDFLAVQESDDKNNDNWSGWERHLPEFYWGRVSLNNYFACVSDSPSSVDGRPSDFTRSEKYTIIPFFGGPYIFTVWENLEDGRIRFQTILDWGYMLSETQDLWAIRAIHSRDQQTYIVMGVKEGGDQGDSWGSFWIGLWTLPRNLVMLKQFEWSSTYELEEPEPEFSYTFAPDMKTVEVRESRPGGETQTYQVDLDKLIREKLANSQSAKQQE